MKLFLALLGISLAALLPSQKARGEDAAPSPESGAAKPKLDFDFFGEQTAREARAEQVTTLPDAPDGELAAKGRTRRWMLGTHQILGPATWVLLVGTTIVGQLNYNQLHGGGSGSTTWQTPHKALVVSTSLAFTTTAAFAIFAPTPFKKPLRFDTGLIHRIAVSAATAGMLTQMVLGWVTTHRANAGNQRDLHALATTHQVVGYATLGCLTVAGAVWLF